MLMLVRFMLVWGLTVKELPVTISKRVHIPLPLQ